MSYVESNAVATAKKAVMAGVVGLTLAAGLCGAAFAQTPPSSQPPAADGQAAPQPKAKDPGDRIICREDESTGSRLHSTRVCHSKREWDQIAKDSGDTVDQLSKSVNHK